MNSTQNKKIYRLLDANMNRAKEGLRVCEDTYRFIKDNKSSTRTFKNFRHQLTDAIGSLKLKKYIKARAIEKDVGRKSINSELKRKNVDDILLANMQRVKESVRVLEEFSKLTDPKAASQLKKVRYEIYAFEKRIIAKS